MARSKVVRKLLRLLNRTLCGRRHHRHRWHSCQAPQWIERALDNNTLRAAWEGNRSLVLRGKTFEYRVYPKMASQGHWEIGNKVLYPPT